MVLSACTCYYNYLDNSNCRELDTVALRYTPTPFFICGSFCGSLILQFNCASAIRFCSSLLQFTFAVDFCSWLLQLTSAICFCSSLLQFASAFEVVWLLLNHMCFNKKQARVMYSYS